MIDPATTLTPTHAPPVRPYLLAMLIGLTVVGLIFGVSPAAAGGLYTVLFLLVAWAQPAVGLLFVVAAAPFPHDISAGLPVKFSLAEINLALMAVVLAGKALSNKVVIRLGPTFVPVMVYLGMCVASTLFGWRGGDAIKSLLQMVLYLIVGVSVFATLVRRREDILPALYGLVAVGVFLSLMMFGARGGFAFGLHKNAAGSILGSIVLVCMELWFSEPNARRRWWWLAALTLCSIGLFFSLSRGAWLGTMTGTLVILAMRGQVKLAWRLALIAVPVLILGWMTLDEQYQEYVFALSSDNRNISARFESIDLAWEQFRRGPLLGTGVGLREEADATNLLMFTLAETGVAGLLAMTWLHWRTLQSMWRARRRLAPTDPLYSTVVLGAALVIARVTHGMFDHYWSRGAIMIAWCLLGAGVGVYLNVVGRGEGKTPRVMQR